MNVDMRALEILCQSITCSEANECHVNSSAHIPLFGRGPLLFIQSNFIGCRGV